MVTEQRTRFTNLQLLLLEQFAREVSEEDLRNIRDLISRYFAERLVKMADEAWVRNGWTNETMEEWLNDPNQ
jgi:hypothetical protein